MSEENTYYDYSHTSKISLRTYVKIIASTAAETERKVFSEGAYRIGLCYARTRLNTGRCFATISGVEFELMPTDFGVGIVVPGLTLYLDGDVTTVRDDEMTFRFENGSAFSNLIILFDRVVWKKDDNFYPAQAKDKTALNNLNQKAK